VALAALGTTYGRKLAYSGPSYDSMAIEGSSVRLRFQHVGGGLTAKGGGPLLQFAIAGADRKFVWADAKIDGDTVVVSSSKMLSGRRALRVGRQSGRLQSVQQGWPARLALRTDDWPMLAKRACERRQFDRFGAGLAGLQFFTKVCHCLETSSARRSVTLGTSSAG